MFTNTTACLKTEIRRTSAGMSVVIRSCLAILILACVASQCLAWSVNVTVNVYQGNSCGSGFVDAGVTYSNGSTCNDFQYQLPGGSYLNVVSSVYCSDTGQPQGFMYKPACGLNEYNVQSNGAPSVTWGQLICWTDGFKTFSAVCNIDYSVSPPTEAPVPSPIAPALEPTSTPVEAPTTVPTVPIETPTFPSPVEVQQPITVPSVTPVEAPVDAPFNVPIIVVIPDSQPTTEPTPVFNAPNPSSVEPSPAEAQTSPDSAAPEPTSKASKSFILSASLAALAASTILVL